MASRAVSSAAAAAAEVTHLTQRDAAEIDEQLMGPLGFSVDQLMVRDYSLVAIAGVIYCEGRYLC
jgi:pyridoxal 5'-phosphate synthase / NAD(P)H-hydrate epimerase